MVSPPARLARILVLLQMKRYWTGEELSTELQVTPRTLRRDLTELRELGYRIATVNGPGGGYQLESGAKVPPLPLRG